MNSHSTQILGLVIIVAWAVFSAKGMKRRLLSLVTILGFMAGGIGVGFAISAWNGNAAIRGNAPINLVILLGAVSAAGCLIRNRQSRTRRIESSHSR
jgi:dipeptide/tripeptide permease